MTEELSKLMIMLPQRFLDKLREYKDLHFHSSNSTAEGLERALDVALDQAKKEITHCHTAAVSPGLTNADVTVYSPSLSSLGNARAKEQSASVHKIKLFLSLWLKFAGRFGIWIKSNVSLLIRSQNVNVYRSIRFNGITLFHERLVMKTQFRICDFFVPLTTSLKPSESSQPNT